MTAVISCPCPWCKLTYLDNCTRTLLFWIAFCIPKTPMSTSKVKPRDSTKGIIKRFSKVTPEIRVIIDVGAQILELTNAEVAQFWLEQTAGVVEGREMPMACIYFDDNNDLLVLSRDGGVELLMVSPYANQLDKCLVYLDEVHIRGTDLKYQVTTAPPSPWDPTLPKIVLLKRACV